MKHHEDREINLFRFIEKVRDEADNCIIRGLSAEYYQEVISAMCMKCFRSADNFDDCESCNIIQEETNDQLYINFEGLENNSTVSE